MDKIIDNKTETLDDLMCGYMLIQPKEGFRFSIDAVLLAHFSKVKKNGLAVDFCSGSGVVAFLTIAHKNPEKVICVEIQRSFCDMIERSAAYNGLKDKVEVVCADIKKAYEILGYESADAVMCNPPYLKPDDGKKSISESINVAKREVETTLASVVASASKILKNKGKFSIVHRASRAEELFYLMEKHNLSVKRARLVQPRVNEAPSLILAEGVKNASKGVKWLPTLNIYHEGGYSKEIKEIYEGER